MASTSNSTSATDLAIDHQGLPMLAQALYAMRSTSDLGTLCTVVGNLAFRALGATEYRLLRLDLRSGALRVLDEFGVETPYVPESGGPVERVLRQEAALFESPMAGAADAGLWREVPGACACLPLVSGGALHGTFLLAFPAPRRFDAETQSTLRAIGDVLGLALERAELERAVASARHRAGDLERRLRDDEETSSQLMSVVAHEIRSPLTAIKAYAEALLDNPTNSHVQRDRFLGIINSECDRLSRLVADILDLSRLESGRRPLRLARFDLGSIVRETLDTLEPAALGRKLELDVRIDPELVIEADPDLLRRLLLNLAGNAVKFSPKGGRVTIEAHRDGEEWVGTVQDEGPGIPPEDLPRIFERFFRSRPGGEGEVEVEGHGLGLAIARGIVELHGGRIWAQSREPRGTRMCFAIPVRQLAAVRARRIARMITSRDDLKGLFVETVDLVAAMVGAEVVSFALVDPEQGDLVIAAARGLDGSQLLGRRTTMRSGVAGVVAAWGKPLLVDNIETDRRFERLSHPQYTTKSLLCVPLQVAGEVLGVFNVTNKNSGDAFTEDDLAVLSMLIDRVGGALERVWTHAGDERVVNEALAAIRSMTRLKRDGLLGGRDVVHWVRGLARALGMDDADVDMLGHVASIHDVGMTQIAAGVDSAAPLTPEARHELERHPEVTLDILRPFGYLSRVGEAILAHHERWDGNGYPSGLAGEAIPLGGRILAVVDAYDSMVKGRPYRPQRSRDDACAELRLHAGSQFDPRVVTAFLALPEIQAEDR